MLLRLCDQSFISGQSFLILSLIHLQPHDFSDQHVCAAYSLECQSHTLFLAIQARLLWVVIL